MARRVLPKVMKTRGPAVHRTFKLGRVFSECPMGLRLANLGPLKGDENATAGKRRFCETFAFHKYRGITREPRFGVRDIEVKPMRRCENPSSLRFDC
jgi:hypothetical protein